MTEPSHYFLSRTIQKSIFLSPLSAHFVATSAKRLGISQCEFIRRAVDACLIDYVKCHLYELPKEAKALTIDPLPTPKAHGWAAKANKDRRQSLPPEKSANTNAS